MPANTPHGLPYPLPTEPVSEGALAIRNLAEALEARKPTQTIITASGNYSPPAGCKAILVECWGGGGGGCGAATTAASQVSGGGGGGGGAYAAKLIANPAGPYAVTVGAGGAGSTGVGAGQAGTATNFGSGLVVAAGGAGAFGGATSAAPTHGGTGGPGGTVAASVGDLVMAGEWGDQSTQIAATSVVGAPGGGSPRGGVRGNRSSGTTWSGGGAGSFPGGGGTGAENAQSQATTRTAGAGAAGLIVITEFY